MSPFPAQLTDRWASRSEPRPDEGKFYWHVLLSEYPQVVAVAREAQARLDHFAGLHMTPPKWLHMTILVAGSTDTIGPNDASAMLEGAARRLSQIPPITVTFGRVLYHPEAIMLGLSRNDDLEPIRGAVQDATRSVIGTCEGVTGGTSESWTPHVTICYSTAQQPAEPIIEALGTRVPTCQATIDTVSLVSQQGAERLWDWHPVGTARLLG